MPKKSFESESKFRLRFSILRKFHKAFYSFFLFFPICFIFAFHICSFKDLDDFDFEVAPLPISTMSPSKVELSSTFSALQLHPLDDSRSQLLDSLRLYQASSSSFFTTITTTTGKPTQFGPFLLVEAAKKKNKPKPRRRRPGEKVRDTQFDEFFAVVKWTYTLAIIPIIFYFVYNLVMDPDLPVIFRQLLKILRLKWLSYLGKKEKLMEEGTGDIMIETNQATYLDEREEINPSFVHRKEKDEAFGAGGDIISSSAERSSGLRRRGGLSSTEKYSSKNFYNDNNYDSPVKSNSPFGKTFKIQEGQKSLSNTFMIDENEPGQNSFNYTYKYATDDKKDDRLISSENENPNRIKEYNNSPYSPDQNLYTNTNMNYNRTKKIRKKSSLALGETTELEYETASNNKNKSMDVDNFGHEISDEERIRKDNTNRAIFKTFLTNTLRAEQLKYDTLQNKQL